MTFLHQALGTQSLIHHPKSILRIHSGKGVVFAILLLNLPCLLAQGGSPNEKYTETVAADDGAELSFEMVAIPAGTFKMGSPPGEAGRNEDEGPQHNVQLSPFYLSTTEISLELFMVFYQETMTEKKGQSGGPETNNEVDTISGPTPIYGDLTMGADADHPAIGMSWLNAVTFCKWLSKMTGKEYRLPTEAEWEYACRAGSDRVWGPVNDESELETFAWWDDNSEGTTQSVGTKEPNAWGLFDMSGNVREWVHDFYSPTRYAQGASQDPVEDPKGPESGRVHVARGGDYSSFPEELRCADRAYEVQDWRSLDPQIPKSTWWLPFMDFIGFRVARSAD